MAAFAGGVAEGSEGQEPFQAGGAQLGLADRDGVAGEHAGLPALCLAGDDRFDDAGEQALGSVEPGRHFLIARAHGRHHLRELRVGRLAVEVVDIEQDARDVGVQHPGHRHAFEGDRPAVDALEGVDERAGMGAVAGAQERAVDIEQDHPRNVAHGWLAPQ